MKIKETLLKILIISLLAATVFALRTYSLGSQTPAINSDTPKLTPFPTAIPPFDLEIPEGDRIIVTGVEVNNFYKSALDFGQIGDTLIVDRADYKIIYYPIDDGFLIPITYSPFEELRAKAEENLLEVLGITKIEACKLTVYITTPAYANPEFAGQNHRLSWCGN